MIMKLRVLASGSSGNCYILESPTGSLLLECGIHWKEIQKGLNFDLSNVQGCLITHEHKDHCKAVREVVKAGIDVYSTKETFEAMGISEHRTHAKTTCIQFKVGPFWVMPFSTEHDAANPVGYLVLEAKTNERIVFITDSYYCRYKFPKINYLCIECNYIKETLDWNIENGYINEAMKPRLLQSHFSLENVKEFLKANDLSQCREIILLHLSNQNADASQMIKEIADITGIVPRIAKPGLEVSLDRFPY